MGTLVGLILIVAAGATVIAVLWVVMREQHVHEEHYIPPQKPPTPAPTHEEIIAESVGTEMVPPAASEPAEQENPETTA